MGEWRGTPAELTAMLMSFQGGIVSYPSYTLGDCAKGAPCRRRNPQNCRECRQSQEGK